VNKVTAIDDRIVIAALAVVWLVFAAGCESTTGISPLEEQISGLRREQRELGRELEELKAANAGLKGQISVLAGLPEKVEAEKLYDLQGIEIGRFTNLYDKDKDGRKEKLIVYLQPVDTLGDAIKAAGVAEVEVWDLSKPQHEALLGRWRVKTSEMKELWFDTFVGANYRLIFDMSESAEGVLTTKGPLTVRVTFTDYSTGKVFTEQKTIEPTDEG